MRLAFFGVGKRAGFQNWLPYGSPVFPVKPCIGYHPAMSITPSIPDELLLAHLSDREKLSDDLWVLPSQLGMLTGRSRDQLEDDRKSGRPPPFFKPFPKSVRYKLGAVRDVMLGPLTEQYGNTTQARIGLEKRRDTGIGFVSFHDWLDNAMPEDEWPFLVRKDGPPVDFFKSLGMGDALREDDECGWLKLDDYLTLRGKASWAAKATSTKESVGEAMKEPAADDRGRKRV